MSAMPISAPSIVVCGKSSRIPDAISAQPVKTWYGVDDPTQVQSRSESERLPTDSTSVTSDGGGNCVGMIFAIP